MKIKHNITRTGSTLSGQILETIFEGDEKRGEVKDYKGFAYSECAPELYEGLFFAHGTNSGKDDIEVRHDYDNEEEAQAMLDKINSITIPTTMETVEPASLTLDEVVNAIATIRKAHLLTSFLNDGTETRVIGAYLDQVKLSILKDVESKLTNQ